MRATEIHVLAGTASANLTVNHLPFRVRDANTHDPQDVAASKYLKRTRRDDAAAGR